MMSLVTRGQVGPSARRWLQAPRAVHVVLIALIVGGLAIGPVVPGSALAADATVRPGARLQAGRGSPASTADRLVVEHVYLVGALAKTIIDGRQGEFAVAIEAVDANSRALADVVGSVQGPDVGRAFLAPWRAHVGLYIDYAFGAATDDAAKKGTALGALNDARGNIDYALTSADTSLQPGVVAELLRPQVGHVLAAVDALADGDLATYYASLGAAAVVAPSVAGPLAQGRMPRPGAPAAAPPVAASSTIAAPTPAGSPAGASTASACSVGGPASRYAPVLADFGRGGAAFVRQQDAAYWSGSGHLVGFERGDGDAFRSSPWGGYLIAGIVISLDERTAADDLRATVRGWTADWSPYNTAALPLGDEAVAVSRLTPWEIDKDQPMSEIFLAMRYCNTISHFLLAVMPDYEPLEQASRYARLVLERMRA